jgi:DNA integrity scanning protein DisA with diadenylate cyclase activity
MSFQLTEHWFYGTQALRVYASGVRCTTVDARRYAERLAKQHRVSVSYVSEHEKGIAVFVSKRKSVIDKVAVS